MKIEMEIEMANVTQFQHAKARLQDQLRAAILEFETATRYVVLEIDVNKTRNGGEDPVSFKPEDAG